MSLEWRLQSNVAGEMKERETKQKKNHKNKYPSEIFHYDVTL